MRLRSLLLLLCCGSAMAIQRARAGLDELLAAKRALPFQILTGGDAAFLERHDAFVFDCDGVLYSGSELLDGAAAAVTGPGDHAPARAQSLQGRVARRLAGRARRGAHGRCSR